MKLSTRYAIHSLLRSTTRTLVSLVGIAIGVAIGVVATAWIRGEDGMMVTSTAESGQGHLQITPHGWQATRDNRLRISADVDLLRRVAAKMPGIDVAAPQVETQALLGMGTRVQSVSLLGVDPIEERKIRRTIRSVTAGRYLQAGDEQSIVIGAELARRLDVEVGDELVVTSVGPGGDMNSALLSVLGLVESGSKELDSTVAHVLFSEAIKLSGRPGASRVALLLNDADAMEDVQQSLSAELETAGVAGVETLNWMQVNPALVAAMASDAAFSKTIVFVVILLVILGVTSAQLTGVLQRGREFSVLLALGMKRRILYRLIFSEAFFLGLAGGALALLLAAWPLYYLSQVGLDLSKMMGEDGMTMGGTLMDPVMKADMGFWVLWTTFGLAFSSSLIGAIYPALYSRRLDAASVLRSRN